MTTIEIRKTAFKAFFDALTSECLNKKGFGAGAYLDSGEIDRLFEKYLDGREPMKDFVKHVVRDMQID